jgi:hypothetical protein
MPNEQSTLAKGLKNANIAEYKEPDEFINRFYFPCE